MGALLVAAVLSTLHLEGAVPADGGDYLEVTFEVPPGTVELEVAHTDGSEVTILDWGVWAPEGFRGWGGGLEDAAVIGVEASSRGYLPGPITPGTWRVIIGKAKLDPAGAAYVIDVEFRDAATLSPRARAAHAPVELSPERRWYAGDFHVHSEESGDAGATFDEIAQLARSRGLDFVNLSDHNTVSQHGLLAADQPRYDDLLWLRGAEITTYAGHGNAVGLAEYVDHRLAPGGRTVAGILGDVAAQGAVFIVNHPVLDLGDSCIGCAWEEADATPWDQVAALELLTGDFELGTLVFVPRVLELWEQLLDAGHAIAVVGGSDDHQAGMDTSSTGSPLGSPTTRVLADGLSERAIVEAVRAGRTVVQLRGPADPMLELTLGDAGIGDTVEGVASAALAVRVTGGVSGQVVRLVRDGAVVAEAELEPGDSVARFDDEPGAGRHRYRAELLDDLGQRVVVTSHLYVDAVAAQGCGCRAPASGDPWLLGLAALALVRRRRRADPVAGATRTTACTRRPRRRAPPRWAAAA
jgi:MYXO-CTERM domain-containing protein